MAASDDSNLCSTCNKPAARRFCVGCEKYFCLKDFREHEQELSVKFDSVIVQLHNEILEQFQKLNKLDYSSSEIFNQINQWKQTTINNIEREIEVIHRELNKSIERERLAIIQQLGPITNEIRSYHDEENFAENDLERLQQNLDEIQRKVEQFSEGNMNHMVLIDNNEINFNRLISICKKPDLIGEISQDAQWSQNGKTVAGGNGIADASNSLYRPFGIFLADDDRTIVIADCWNHRIVQSKIGDVTEQVVAGGNGQGNRLDQFNNPADVIIDKETDSLIISDWQNRRVVRWSRHRGTAQGEILISNIYCRGLAMDNQRRLYVSDNEKQEIRRYQMEGDMTHGDLVAGGNGKGSGLNQFNCPIFIFVDQQYSIYVSDHFNHRVMKWNQGATEGIVIAGGLGKGEALTQLSHPEGLFVDNSGTLYVAESRNHRVTRWLQGTTQGFVIIGKNAQLNWPIGLSFDRQGNIYVGESSLEGPHRVQRFSIQGKIPLQ